MLHIRKTLLMRDIVTSEMGHIADHPTVRAAALAVIGNPFAGRYVEDLTELFEAGRTLGEQLMPDLVRLLQRSPVFHMARAQSWAPTVSSSTVAPVYIRCWASRCERPPYRCLTHHGPTRLSWCLRWRTVAGHTHAAEALRDRASRFDALLGGELGAGGDILKGIAGAAIE